MIALAVALSLLVHGGRKGDELAYQLILSFVGAAYGLLLGLLVVLAVGHYTDVRHEAQREAGSLIALYDTLTV